MVQTSSTLEGLHIEVVDHDMAKILASKTVAERAAMVGSAHRSAKLLLAAGARLRHPDWSASEINAEVSRLLLNGTV
jgi:hypothetical protein